RDFLDANELAGAHAGQDRRGDERLGPRSAVEEHRVVPAVTQMILVRAGGALDGQGARTADGRGEGRADHALGGAWLPDEQQAPLAGQRYHAALDKRPRADELRLDDHRLRRTRR